MRGPIEFTVLEFAGNCFKGEVLDALTNAVNKEIIKEDIYYGICN